MPTYEFLCDPCGPFEQWRDHRDVPDTVFCPQCGEAARRRFAAPAARTPRAMRLMGGAKAEGRDRIARAHTGEPKVLTGPPPGARVTGGLNRPLKIHAHDRGPSRPWQVGHC
jgi:putative FmdB family regulatory protein